MSSTDAVFSPRGVKTNYQPQLSAIYKTTSRSSVRGMKGTGPTSITATPVWSRKPVTLTETPKTYTKPAYEDTTKSATQETPYPKILQDGAVESFRPQEVHEKVTYAEPLSPPNEEEVLVQTSEDKEGQEDWSNVGVEHPEERPAESIISCQVESGLSAEPSFNDEVNQQQFMTPNLTPYHVKMIEESCDFADETDKDVPFEIPAEKEDAQEPNAPIDAWGEKESKGQEVEHVQEEASDSETEAVLEQNFESRTSSPVSEYEPEESSLNKATDLSKDENIVKEEAAETTQEINSAEQEVGTSETDAEERLYPDGEEMDTWDSVIERKVDLKTYVGVNKDEEQQHAEPEEDISARGQEPQKREIKHPSAANIPQDDKMASSLMEAQVGDERNHADQEHVQLPNNEEDDEEEDSQNVSVSWRTELESDSYALDNTLADTRPLIRYKSDETDANTQASHMDESESSEGEQEKKIGETGTGTWSEGKTKKSGTMEDLCEEGEGEVLDEEYDLGYIHTEERDVGHGMTESERDTPENETASAEEIRNVSEGHSDEETEELNKPVVPSNVDYDEELEIDRLVEQELENLATDSYSVHFAQQKVSMSEKMSVEEMTEQEEAGKTETEDTSSCADQPSENQNLNGTSVVMPQTDTVGDEGVQDEDQEAPEKKEEEVEHNESMVTHADVTEDHSSFSDFISRPDVEEISNTEEPNSAFQVAADQENLQDVSVPTEVKEVVPLEASSVKSSSSQEHLVEEVAGCQEVQETEAEWEVLKNPSEECESEHQNQDVEDNLPESAEKYLQDDGGSDEGAMTPKEEQGDISPDNVPEENDIFGVKDSTEVLNTNGKDNGLHGFFSSGVKNDFWMSSLETGATFQPDNPSNEAAEQTNKNLGFADNMVWGDLENPNVVNWNSRLDIDSSSKALVAKKEQEHSEVKQVLKGELVHSEESEAEGESWSSGEEAV